MIEQVANIAKYIYDLLIYDGISAERLSYEGFARQNPLYPEEKTEEEKQQIEEWKLEL